MALLRPLAMLSRPLLVFAASLTVRRPAGVALPALGQVSDFLSL